MTLMALDNRRLLVLTRSMQRPRSPPTADRGLWPRRVRPVDPLAVLSTVAGYMIPSPAVRWAGLTCHATLHSRQLETPRAQQTGARSVLDGWRCSNGCIEPPRIVTPYTTSPGESSGNPLVRISAFLRRTAFCFIVLGSSVNRQ